MHIKQQNKPSERRIDGGNEVGDRSERPWGAKRKVERLGGRGGGRRQTTTKGWTPERKNAERELPYRNNVPNRQSDERAQRPDTVPGDEQAKRNREATGDIGRGKRAATGASNLFSSTSKETLEKRGDSFISEKKRMGGWTLFQPKQPQSSSRTTEAGRITGRLPHPGKTKRMA